MRKKYISLKLSLTEDRKNYLEIDDDETGSMVVTSLTFLWSIIAAVNSRLILLQVDAADINGEGHTQTIAYTSLLINFLPNFY